MNTILMWGIKRKINNLTEESEPDKPGFFESLKDSTYDLYQQAGVACSDAYKSTKEWFQSVGVNHCGKKYCNIRPDNGERWCLVHKCRNCGSKALRYKRFCAQHSLSE